MGTARDEAVGIGRLLKNAFDTNVLARLFVVGLVCGIIGWVAQFGKVGAAISISLLITLFALAGTWWRSQRR